MDKILDILKNFNKIQYKDIPAKAIVTAKREILDTLGVALGGSSRPGVVELVDLTKEWGGKQESTVIGYGTRVPAPNAAQVNAVMAHALDYDDAHDGAVVHPGVITVPTAFAMVERIGGMDGENFITSIILGDDFICRLGLAVASRINPMKVGWHQTALFGFLCASATAGRIIGLNGDQMVNALGIAYHRCSGNGQCVIDGAMTKRLGPGFAVQGGIVAALLAEKGITGAKNCLEGENGLFNQFHRGNYDPEILTSELGKKFEGENISFKPYPCCRGTHTSIDATLELLNEYNITPKDINRITVFAGEGNYKLLCSPLEIKRNPRSIVDLQFNIPWTVAVALAKKSVTITDFTDDAINNNDVREVLQKINVELDHKLSRSNQAEPAVIEINLLNGNNLVKSCDCALGSPEKPITLSYCVNKFKDCSSYSVNPISGNAIEKVINMVEHIEELKDVTEILRVIS
jgi:2-methylcitrate dehydratase PrpD